MGSENGFLDVFGKSKVRDHLELEEMNLLFQELKY